MVILELDRPRELRFGFKALKMAKAMIKKTLPELMSEMKENKQAYMEDSVFEKLMYCGLLADDKDLELETIDNILDKMTYADLNDKLLEAVFEAYGMKEVKIEESEVEIVELENKKK